MDQLDERHYFVTPVYMVKKPEFLPAVSEVSQKYLAKSRARKKSKNPIVVMSGSYMAEPAVAPFAQYVSQTAWNILSAQGYKMKDMVTYFTEMWTQEHNTMSSMETHVHGHGVQLSCFYFLDVPENSSKVVIHDPRPGKLMGHLYPEEPRKVSMAAHQIVFKPEPGLMIFLNSWVPHSFTKNLGKGPLRFVHMNLAVTLSPEALKAAQEGKKPTEKAVEVL